MSKCGPSRVSARRFSRYPGPPMQNGGIWPSLQMRWPSLQMRRLDQRLLFNAKKSTVEKQKVRNHADRENGKDL